MNACDDLLVRHADRLHLRDALLGGLGEVALEHAAGGHRILAAALAGMRAPTRRTSTLGFSEAVCASAAAAIDEQPADYFSTGACFFV